MFWWLWKLANIIRNYLFIGAFLASEKGHVNMCFTCESVVEMCHVLWQSQKSTSSRVIWLCFIKVSQVLIWCGKVWMDIWCLKNIQIPFWQPRSSLNVVLKTFRCAFDVLKHHWNKRIKLKKNRKVWQRKSGCLGIISRCLSGEQQQLQQELEQEQQVC